MTEETPELTLESVTSVEVADLTDDQKTFLSDNAGELTDEQKEIYKDVLTPADDDSEVNPDDVKIPTRNPIPEEKTEESDEEGDEEEIDPEDKKNIGKVVDEKLHDFRGTLSQVQVLKDENEADRYISEHQEFKRFRGVMLKYMAHPAYKNIPVENIAVIAAGDQLQKLGAEKERAAAQKAKATRDGGTTVRTPSGEKNWLTASKEEFEKKKNEVLSRR